MAGRGTAGRGRQQSGVTGSDCSEFGGKVPTVKGRCQQLRAEDRSCEQVPAVAGRRQELRAGASSCGQWLAGGHWFLCFMQRQKFL